MQIVKRYLEREVLENSVGTEIEEGLLQDENRCTTSKARIDEYTIGYRRVSGNSRNKVITGPFMI